MNRLKALGLSSLLALAPGLALADHDNSLSSGSANSASNRGFYDYADVVETQPIFRTVRVDQPVQNCWDERVVRNDYDNRSRPPANTAGRAIMGGILGGLVGAQFGDGNVRTAATMAGALIGSEVARGHAERDAYYRDQANRNNSNQHVSYEERCEVSHEYYEEERIDGFRVTYVFNGETYTTRMSRDPGEQIRVWVSVRPAE